MNQPIRIGIIICDRYRDCAGGKCFRALRDREGAFSRYDNHEVEVVGYTSCGGCPGGNIEYAPAELKRNGAEVVIGTHPIPEKYYAIHRELGTWKSPEWKMIIEPTSCDQATRISYD